MALSFPHRRGPPPLSPLDTLDRWDHKLVIMYSICMVPQRCLCSGCSIGAGRNCRWDGGIVRETVQWSLFKEVWLSCRHRWETNSAKMWEEEKKNSRQRLDERSLIKCTLLLKMKQFNCCWKKFPNYWGRPCVSYLTPKDNQCLGFLKMTAFHSELGQVCHYAADLAAGPMTK